MKFLFKNLIFLVLSSLVVFFLSGCAAKKNLPCPKVAKLSEASSITSFFPGEGRDIIDIETETLVGSIVRNCYYEKSNVFVKTRIQFKSSKGPKTSKEKENLKYFVAVLDKDEKIIGREVFDLIIKYPKNSKKAQVYESSEQIIPIRADSRGIDYVILVGFQLEPIDLIYNRQQRKEGKIKRLP